MSYRTIVNKTQLFGNNEYYPEWIEFIQSQGIKVDSEWNYEGEIRDFMQALSATEQITKRLHDERLEQMQKKLHKRSIFDLNGIPEELDKQYPNDRFRSSLLDELINITKSGYMFLPYTLFKICEPKLEQLDPFTIPRHLYCYKIKDGETITVSAS